MTNIYNTTDLNKSGGYGMMSPAASSNGGSQKSFSSVASFRSVTHPNFLKRLAKKQLDLKRDNFSGNQQKWNKIGQGHYADVYKTHVKPKYQTEDAKPVEAAAKILKDRHGQTEFQNEALMLAEAHGLLDTCIVPVIGIFFPDKRDKPKDGDFWGFTRTMLVTEFMHNGDAEKFLKIPENVIPHPLVLKWCKQLAKAAVFMNAHGIVHRDIGARNCFLDYDMDLKLGDFGLARKSEGNQTVYNAISMGRALPLPYLSVEAFQEMVFSHKSDIWAIAITFWEFYTRCEKVPYVGEIPAAQLATDLDKGKRLRRPDLMPKSIYKLCEECWRKDPNDRPDGDELLRKTSDICDRPLSFKINVDKCYIGGNTDSIKIYETRIEMEEEKKMANDSQHVDLLQRGLHETHREEDTPFIPINNTITDIGYDDKSVGFIGMVRRKKWMVVVLAVILLLVIIIILSRVMLKSETDTIINPSIKPELVTVTEKPAPAPPTPPTIPDEIVSTVEKLIENPEKLTEVETSSLTEAWEQTEIPTEPTPEPK